MHNDNNGKYQYTHVSCYTWHHTHTHIHELHEASTFSRVLDATCRRSSGVLDRRHPTDLHHGLPRRRRRRDEAKEDRLALLEDRQKT